jgi:hypothetical protein
MKRGKAFYPMLIFGQVTSPRGEFTYIAIPPSEKALGQALALAATLAGEAEITLLNVVQDLVLTATVFERPPIPFKAERRGDIV